MQNNAGTSRSLERIIAGTHRGAADPPGR